MIPFKKILVFLLCLSTSLIRCNDYYCKDKINKTTLPLTKSCNEISIITNVCAPIDKYIAKWTPNINEDENSLINTRIDFLAKILADIKKIFEGKHLDDNDIEQLSKGIANTIIKSNYIVIPNGNLSDFCDLIIKPLMTVIKDEKSLEILNYMLTYLNNHKTVELYKKGLYGYINCKDTNIKIKIPIEEFNETLKIKIEDKIERDIELEIDINHLFKIATLGKTISGFHLDYMNIFENNKIIKKDPECKICFKQYAADNYDYCAKPKTLFNSNLTQEAVINIIKQCFMLDTKISNFSKEKGGLYIFDAYNPKNKTDTRIAIRILKTNSSLVLKLASAYPSLESQQCFSLESRQCLSPECQQSAQAE